MISLKGNINLMIQEAKRTNLTSYIIMEIKMPDGSRVVRKFPEQICDYTATSVNFTKFRFIDYIYDNVDIWKVINPDNIVWVKLKLSSDPAPNILKKGPQRAGGLG